MKTAIDTSSLIFAEEEKILDDLLNNAELTAPIEVKNELGKSSRSGQCLHRQILLKLMKKSDFFLESRNVFLSTRKYLKDVVKVSVPNIGDGELSCIALTKEKKVDNFITEDDGAIGIAIAIFQFGESKIFILIEYLDRYNLLNEKARKSLFERTLKNKKDYIDKHQTSPIAIRIMRLGMTYGSKCYGGSVISG